MKLYYFIDPKGNFGDDLNPWMWPKLLDGTLDNDDRELLIGIGTLLNHRLPKGPVKHVLGSGVGYGELPALMDEFRVHALRGPLSAKALDAPAHLAITDPAVLIRTLRPKRSTAVSGRIGFMLTGRAIADFNWLPVAQQAGVHFISCHWDVERVLQEIESCEILLTEAMHGAIVADALRVPWIPIVCSDIVLEFKWRDWLESVGLEYKPNRIGALYNRNHGLNVVNRTKNWLKRNVLQVMNRETLANAHRPDSLESDVQDAILRIRKAATGQSMLSRESILESHCSRYLELIDKFKRGCASPWIDGAQPALGYQ